ncbi:MAG: TetR/AcrR family transcriptional regulator [Bacteroidales bacterium]|nr:TetR/AcrR family transcriptional regulator [Bacteroidales bacterium]
MVAASHSNDNQEKTKLIIEAAQKRFGVYGLMKTTMREIATDLNMSKGLLYYYFPDKEHLYKAVVEKEQNEFLEILKDKIEKNPDPEENLKEYVNLRMSYFKSLLNLNRLSFDSSEEIKSIMSDVWIEFRNKEIAIIKKVLKKGIDLESFNISKVDESAILFVDLLKGLRNMEINKKRIFFIDEIEYDLLSKKSNDFVEIFIKGLKYR